MQIDSHQHFWRYDAVRDAWITDEMRVLQRDFLPERFEPDAGTDGMDATVAVFCKLSGFITEADWDNWNRELLEPYRLGLARVPAGGFV
jgi:predicted TIM-barrel fold metal-dependent hydrolase